MIEEKDKFIDENLELRDKGAFSYSKYVIGGLLPKFDRMRENKAIKSSKTGKRPRAKKQETGKPDYGDITDEIGIFGKHSLEIESENEKRKDIYKDGTWWDGKLEGIGK